MSLHSTVRRLLFTRPLANCAAVLYLSLPLTPASAQDDPSGAAADPYGYGYGYDGDDGSGGGYGDSNGHGWGVGYDSGDMGSGSYDHPYLDSDGDGLLDTEESALGTNPFSADTDGDGLSDYMEVYGYSIQRSTISSYPTTDYHYDPQTGKDKNAGLKLHEHFEIICSKLHHTIQRSALFFISGILFTAIPPACYLRRTLMSSYH